MKVSLDFPRWLAISRNSPCYVRGPQDRSRINLVQKRKPVAFWATTGIRKDLLHLFPMFSSLLTLEALISSSAKHSAMVLMFLKAASRAPVHSSHIAWLTRRRGDTSTAWRRTVPARPIRVESSRGPEFMMANTKIWNKNQRRPWISNQIHFQSQCASDFVFTLFSIVARISTKTSLKWTRSSGYFLA